jgi:predicted MFS family arabinose efflux permease
MSAPPSGSLLRSRQYAWYVLGLLATLNFFNYGNRNVILPVYDDLRAAFGFSNAELGLLTTVFMGLHAMVALPAGWAADRYDRRAVIAIGAAVWSAGGFAVAMAAGTGSMLAGRAVAGLGTGALVPVANALLCDVFPAKDKARTVSVFNIGLFLGGAAGFGIGAVLGYPLGVLVVAAPPIALALLVARLDVPARRASIADERDRVHWHVFTAQALSVLRVPTLRWLLGGAILISFANGGYLAWFVEFVSATKGLSLEEATLVFGASALTGGLSGVVVGGVVADRLYRYVPFGRLAAISLGLGTAVPFALLAIYVDRGAGFVAAAWALMFFIPWYHGPMAAVVDDLVSDDRAATAQAGIICLMHLLGTAPSSYVVGLVADRVGLRTAMLVPTAAVLLAAAVFAGGWRHLEADRAAAGC